MHHGGGRRPTLRRRRAEVGHRRGRVPLVGRRSRRGLQGTGSKQDGPRTTDVARDTPHVLVDSPDHGSVKLGLVAAVGPPRASLVEDGHTAVHGTGHAWRRELGAIGVCDEPSHGHLDLPSVVAGAGADTRPVRGPVLGQGGGAGGQLVHGDKGDSTILREHWDMVGRGDGVARRILKVLHSCRAGRKESGLKRGRLPQRVPTAVTEVRRVRVRVHAGPGRSVHVIGSPRLFAMSGAI